MRFESPADSQVEVWAGVECTVNRVGERYFDQFERSGHAGRLSDLDLLAELGVSAVRYPVLWERTAPDGPASIDWAWADARLGRLRELGVRSIVGLLHHGSGPRDTSLIDPAFPEKFAAYARRVAGRFPWVNDWTPINEPLTTARFSGLYGHWYPHGRDDETFARVLLNQCRAIVLAMRAVREINPRARLIQTEDLGKTYSTRRLKYQAKFENDRRWLTFDLLCGRVTPEHPLWKYLHLGVGEAELWWHVEHHCPPDVIGSNHYLTSERFLDERLARYPPHTHGGNLWHAYADVEAVRVCAEGTAGPRALLREAWERYQLPLAVTEAHLGCTREEQVRWLKEVWDAAVGLRREEGADVRAVTAWSALGAFDWDSLMTCDAGHYEPGLFDLRAPAPRPTALARAVRDLARTGDCLHPVLDSPGWWRRLGRLQYRPVSHKGIHDGGAPHASQGVNMRGETLRPILITGATGTLGRAFARVCERRGLTYQLLTRQELDIADAAGVEVALADYEPWAIINAAGYVRVDDAERDRDRCFRENTTGPATLAAACARRGVALVTFSSDLVFDGAQQPSPYVERDAPVPLNIYGESKAEAERRVLELHPPALVIRTSAFFGPWDEYNFVIAALRALASGSGEFRAADDMVISPTYVPDLVNASLDLLIDGERGVWHLANQGAVTWFELACAAAQAAGLDAEGVVPASMVSFALPAARPAYAALASERGQLLPPLSDALGRFARDCEMSWAPAQEESDDELSPRARRAVAGRK